MTVKNTQEVPVVFECQGSQLLGVVHEPANPSRYGVITLIAGGPQFRGGVGRGMVSMARALCAEGVAVMRFDYRGMGDSEGEFVGFEDIADDLQAAVDALIAQVPAVEKVVLWGGCDGASGAMIHGWKIPQIHSLVLANPWVYTPTIEAAVRKQHYLSRLREASFWKKVFRFEYNLGAYLASAIAKVKGRIVGVFSSPGNSGDDDSSGTFVDRMLAGLRRFDGPVLFLLSGQSIVSKEFDELLATEKGWREVYEREGSKRVDLEDADQTFSTQADRLAANKVISGWVKSL
ncbi:MAG: hydrolase 1, exosortase A system-associated [Halioglobus sp.]